MLKASSFTLILMMSFKIDNNELSQIDTEGLYGSHRGSFFLTEIKFGLQIPSSWCHSFDTTGFHFISTGIEFETEISSS